MTDSNYEDPEPLAGLLVSSGGDSDIDSSQSICSGSDTHSGHTSLSVLTDKSSASGTTIHVTTTSQSPELDQQQQFKSSTITLISPPAPPSISPTPNTSNQYQAAVGSTQQQQQQSRFGVGTLLPWGVHKDRSYASVSAPVNVTAGAGGVTIQGSAPSALSGSVQQSVDMDIRPGEFVMRTLFADFTVQAEKKIEAVMSEPQDKLISKLLQRGGEDAQFDQLLSAFGSVAEHCLPSLLRALFSWYERQMSDQALAYYQHKPHFHQSIQQQQHTRNKSNESNSCLGSQTTSVTATGSSIGGVDSSADRSGSGVVMGVGVQTQLQQQFGVGGYAVNSGSAYSMLVSDDKAGDKSGSGSCTNSVLLSGDFPSNLFSSSTSTSNSSNSTTSTNIPHSASTPTPGSSTSGPGSCSSSSTSSTIPLATPPLSTIGSASGIAISTQTSDALLLASLAGGLVVGSASTVTAADRSEAEVQQERRDLAVEFLFCLVLIEVLRQLSFHPGHEDLVAYIECLSFKHFKYRDGIQSSSNAGNIHIIADLYAEVIGALAQSRFMSVRARFMAELKELRARDPSPHTTQMIIALLMGMKFFRVKMVPIEEFEASFQFMQECAQYFLDPNVKDKDIKHALAGLFVEILVPVAASVKNEVNVPCLKNFVEMLYSSTLDASTKSKHRLALFPLVTCLLCVSQKQFFLQNWHCFLAMCLSHLKNRDHKICRVALESLYRLLWVYMIRIKCESNSATQSRLQSIVNSLFPKGSKAVVPRDTPLNIFVKIIQFIAQERLDFAMREIVFDLLSVGRPIKIILTPERMSIGLRAFLVVADSLQQKEGEPPMPRSMGVLPSGNTLRVRKTFLNKMLTDDTARSIGMSSYFPHVRRVFVDILRALDAQYGRPLMMTSTQNVNKEPDEMITGERKPRIDLFRTCVAAVPRLIPDGMTGSELVDLLARLTVHMDEELRGLAFQSLLTLVLDFPDWRHDVLYGVTGFLTRDVADTCAAHLIDSGLRMLLQLLGAWKSALCTGTATTVCGSSGDGGYMRKDVNHGATGITNDLILTAPSSAVQQQQHFTKGKAVGATTTTGLAGSGNSAAVSAASAAALTSVLHHVEAFALVTLCQYRVTARRLSVHILREVKQLLRLLAPAGIQPAVIDVLDGCCGEVVDKCMAALPPAERAAALGGSGGAGAAASACTATAGATIDMLWLADRNSAVWTANLQEDGTLKSSSAATGMGLNAADPWSMCLFGFLERERLPVACPAAVSHAWPIVFGRVNMLFPVIDPTPVNDNRASLLRSSATIKKPLNERDMYIHLWKNYITFATRVVPPIPSPIIRCASPDLSISALDVSLDTSAALAPLADFSASMENLVGAATVQTPTSSTQQTPTCELTNLLGINTSLLGASTGRFTLPLSAIRRQTQKPRNQPASSSPDSLSTDRGDQKTSGSNASPNALYKLLVPLLRCEINNVRDAAVIALGHINSEALKDLMEELVLPIREAVDRKQENVRRRRRRDALRLQLVHVLERMAECGTFANNAACVLDHRQALHPIFVEYIEGARLYLDQEPDKMTVGVKDLTVHLAGWVRKLIKSFSLETCHTLLDRNLRQHLFTLFSHFAGCYGPPTPATSTSVSHTHGHAHSMSTTTEQQIYQQHQQPYHTYMDNNQQHQQCVLSSTSSSKHKCCLCTELQLAALQAMSALLCCGPCFNPAALGDDVNTGYYEWLDVMLNSPDERVYALGKETVVLLLECNPDIGPLLDWAVDRCYTGSAAVADGCFLSLATIFSAREYPCDHYTGVINVTLLNTGCPRPTVRDAALQLLQILDKRFFGAIVPLAEGDLAEGDNGRSTLDALLATTYCRSQVHLSGQLALLHPELTMPMFSEITVRLQTARPEVRQLLLQYILPWLHNMELVDPNIPPSNPLFYYQFQGDSNRTRGRREGWGSAEATEMVLNNIFYITAKFDDTHPKEIEEVWATLSTAWPNNMKIIIRYLIIISGMAPTELLPYAKRVVLFLARVQPVRLLDEMMFELQTVETLNCLIERTETPPFYRLTVMRKASSHSDGTGGPGQTDSSSRSDLGVEKGTIHTKRHSGEDPMKCGTPKCENMKSMPEFSPKTRGHMNLLEDMCTPGTDENLEDLFSMSRTTGDKTELMSAIPQPLPLPMPEYGGFFAPLSNYLPESSQPISGFHRCNVAVMLLCDIVVDGIELDWNLQVPLMLHVVFLGLDHTRPLVRRHCAQLLLNLLVVLAQHNDHLTVARIMLNSKTKELELGLSVASLPVVTHIFTEPDPRFDTYLHGTMPIGSSELASTSKDMLMSSSTVNIASVASGDKLKEPSNAAPPVIVTPEKEQDTAWTVPDFAQTPLSTQAVIKSMIDFLATRQHVPLWNYEDITAKVWQVRSAEQMECFLQHVIHVFQQSLPSAHISDRWAQTALQLGLSCSSRHYAGRSLQIFRGLRMPITARTLSDILSRLVETVAEQGEDMQGYVTELLLTLESAVDSLESDFRPLDFLRDFFKSTPNLNNNPHNTPKSRNNNQQPQQNEQTCLGASTGASGNTGANSASATHANGGDIVPPLSSTGTTNTGNIQHMSHSHTGHGRSTSYSVSYGMRGSNKMMTGAAIGAAAAIGVSGVIGTNGGGVIDGSANKGLDSMRGRTGSEVESRSNNSLYRFYSNLPRSRSAQSLKLLGDSSATQDDKLTILAQLFWLAVSLLESDYEHEFLLALRLLARVLHRLPLDRPDARDKVEKIQAQLRWPQFPGVHALLLKGCTHPNIYEPVVALLSAFTPLLEFAVADPTQSAAFPMNVIALLPYMLLNYEDANELCIVSAENIAQVSIEKSKKLENLGTVMNLYSRRTFSKESFQWTKCVVKYLNDTYSHMSLAMLAFLVEVLEKGPTASQQPVLNILHCMLHYVDLASAAAQPINADLLRVIARYIEGAHWKEALKILKLVVTRSSSLVAPPTSIQYHSNWETSLTTLPHPSFSDLDVFTRKELPGRTMDFTFDLSQTPVIGRRLLTKTDDNMLNSTKPIASPRRSCSLSPADTGPLSGWKRPWISQGRVRECLVNLLTTCGQRVGLPKSPSVIFSQSSDLLERQSSMASSTEEVSGANNDLSGGSRRDDATADFGVFKDFDFLEYESESIEAESTDNFNWGVRRRPLSEGEEEPGSLRLLEESLSEQTPVLTVRKFSQSRVLTEESSDDEIGGSESPLDELATATVQEDFGNADNNSSSGISGGISGTNEPRIPSRYGPSSGNSSLRHGVRRRDSTGGRSDTSESSVGDLGDVTPCNDSPNVSQMINLRPMPRSDTIEAWTTFVQTSSIDNPSNMLKLFHHLQKLIKCVASTAISLSRDACTCLATAATSTNRQLQPHSPSAAANFSSAAAVTTIKVLSVRLASVVDIATHRLLIGAHSANHNYVWFNTTALGGQTAARIAEVMRYGVLEVQEHLETWWGKFERATMYSDAAKTSLKLEQLAAAAAANSTPVTPTPSPSTPTTPSSSTAASQQSGQQQQGHTNLGKQQYHTVSHHNLHHEDYLLELSKALYKLYFQLLLLVESTHKMTTHLVQGLRSAGFRDVSNEVSAVCAALRRAAEDQETDGGTPTQGHNAVTTSPVAGSSTSLEEVIHKIYELIIGEKWSNALSYMRQHRAVVSRPLDVTPTIDVDDNIAMVVNTYCRKLMVERPDCFVVTNQESDMRDIYGRLFQVSAALNDLETIINNDFVQTLNK